MSLIRRGIAQAFPKPNPFRPGSHASMFAWVVELLRRGVPADDVKHAMVVVGEEHRKRQLAEAERQERQEDLMLAEMQRREGAIAAAGQLFLDVGFTDGGPDGSGPRGDL